MDILDLSVGEKRTSRRKAHVPQRRQAQEEDAHGVAQPAAAALEEQEPLPNSNETEDREQAACGSRQRTICLETTPRTRSRLAELAAEQQKNQSDSEHPVPIQPFASNRHYVERNNNRVLSPYSNISNDGSNRCADESRTPSPSILMSSSASSSGKSMSEDQQNNTNYVANVNSNNSNVLPSLSSMRTVELSSNSPQPISDLAAFQERYNNLSASLPQSLMGQALKNSAPNSYGSFDVQPTDTPGIPERTKKQNRWAFNVWREWARKRNLASGVGSAAFGKVPLDVGKATEEELNFWLSKFVKEIRRKDGNPYPPHTLMQIVMGIQRYLRQQAGRPSICILDRSNPVYGRFRSVLDNRIKELTNEGVTSTHKSGRRSSLPASNSSSSLSNSFSGYPDQTVLWNAGIIGNDTALGLLNAVFFHNTVTFGIRNIDDHWNLKMSHFVHGNRGQQSQSYIEFVPSRDPLYVNRGMTKDCRVYAEPSNPRCVVKLFQNYMSLIPPDGAFYRHPQEPTLVDRSIRFSDQWVGKNRLRAMIKHVFDSTRLDGRDRQQSITPSAPTTVNQKQVIDQNQTTTPATTESGAMMQNVYDRLAQVFMQFSYMRSSPQLNQESSNSSSPQKNPSSNPEVLKPCLSSSIKEESNALKRNSSPNSSSQEINSKRSRTLSDDFSPKSLRVDEEDEIDDVKVTSSCEKEMDQDKLELAVPHSIVAVTIIKGTRRYQLQLDD